MGTMMEQMTLIAPDISYAARDEASNPAQPEGSDE
jgi:hypothetical protein